jgi:hypothetical protein
LPLHPYAPLYPDESCQFLLSARCCKSTGRNHPPGESLFLNRPETRSPCQTPPDRANRSERESAPHLE